MPSPRGKKDNKEELLECGRLSKKPPVWLSDHAKKVWTDTISDLDAAGIPLLTIHRQAMIGFCSACSDLKEAGEILAKEGHLVDGGREGQKRHPAGSMRTQALTAVRAYSAELGLTPTSSGRLVIPTKPKSNKFAEL